MTSCTTYCKAYQCPSVCQGSSQTCTDPLYTYNKDATGTCVPANGLTGQYKTCADCMQPGPPPPPPPPPPPSDQCPGSYCKSYQCPSVCQGSSQPCTDPTVTYDKNATGTCVPANGQSGQYKTCADCMKPGPPPPPPSQCPAGSPRLSDICPSVCQGSSQPCSDPTKTYNRDSTGACSVAVGQSGQYKTCA